MPGSTTTPPANSPSSGICYQVIKLNVDGTIGYLECDSRPYILCIFSFHVINSGNIVSGDLSFNSGAIGMIAV